MGVKTQKKDRTTLWITLAIVLLLAASILLYAFSASGITARNTVVIESENYKVDAAMISYFENYVYQNIYYQYYQIYAQYASLLGGDVTSYIQNAIASSGIDFFSEAVEMVKSILIFCEDAKASGITLDADDIESIDAELNSYKGQFKAMFGEGVKASDIRKSIELQVLATKSIEKFEADAMDAITDADINTYINNNKEAFYVTNYLKADLTVKAEDYVNDKEGFAAAKALVNEYYEKLNLAANVDEFMSMMIEYKVKAEFDKVASEEIPAELMPEKAVLLEKRQAIIDNIVKVLVKGETLSDEAQGTNLVDDTLLVIEAYFLEECMEMFDNAELTQSYVEAHEHDGTEAAHEEPTELALWLSDAKNGNYSLYKEDLSSDDAYSFAVYMITGASHVDMSISKNVGHLLVSAVKGTATEEEIAAAKDKAEAYLAEYLAGEKTKDSFEEIAKKNTADSSVFYTGITSDTNFVAEFKDWVLDADRKVGDTGIVQTDYGYHVMYYYEAVTSTENAKAGIVDEKYEEYLKANEGDYTVNEKAMAKYGK